METPEDALIAYLRSIGSPRDVVQRAEVCKKILPGVVTYVEDIGTPEDQRIQVAATICNTLVKG